MPTIANIVVVATSLWLVGCDSGFYTHGFVEFADFTQKKKA